MARIRSIKPQFFRHEELQELETANPHNRPMLVFSGLFTVADREGRFEWRPRQIKLDILPFLEFDMAETLELLASRGFVVKYQHGGKTYGNIPTFLEHQCPNKKEPASRIPAPHQHSTSTVPTRGEVEGEKEREKEGEVEIPDDSDKMVLEIIQAYPFSKYRNELEIPPVITSAILQAVHLEGNDFGAVLEYTRTYAKSADNPKFVMAPEKFYLDPNLYRREWNAKPVGKFTQLLSTVSEPYGELGEFSGTTGDR